MQTFPSPSFAIRWAEHAEGLAIVNERVHGPFSFLAAGKRYTTGRGLTCRAEDWSK